MNKSDGIFSNLTSTTTFRLKFRISHSLPLSGEVEKHGHSMFLEACFKNPSKGSGAEVSAESNYFLWRENVKSSLSELERELDGCWIDDFFEPATSENFLLFIYKKMQNDPALKNLVCLALQETIKNRFVLKVS